MNAITEHNAYKTNEVKIRRSRKSGHIIFKTSMANSKTTVGIFILFFWVGIFVVYGQKRYLDSIYSQIRVQNYVYSDTLKLDYYTAKKDGDATRPLLVLVHGGGFSNGKRNNPLESGFCMDMAKKGFAVASIDYRLTRQGKGFGCDCPAEEKMETFLKASEDLLLAVQFLMDKEEDLLFDSNNIILMGSSAGAEVVMNTVFMRHHYEFRHLPYGKVKFAGIISMAGAVLDAGYITNETAVPTLMFHGQKDNLVPFATAPHHYCEPVTSGYIMLEGPKAIAQKLEEFNTPYTLIHNPEGKHNWANIPYSYTEQASRFIDAIIMGNDIEQSKIRVAQ